MPFVVLCIGSAELGAPNLNDLIFDLLCLAIFDADVDLHVSTLSHLHTVGDQGESHFSTGLPFGILGQSDHTVFALVVFGS